MHVYNFQFIGINEENKTICFPNMQYISDHRLKEYILVAKFRMIVTFTIMGVPASIIPERPDIHLYSGTDAGWKTSLLVHSCAFRMKNVSFQYNGIGAGWRILSPVHGGKSPCRAALIQEKHSFLLVYSILLQGGQIFLLMQWYCCRMVNVDSGTGWNKGWESFL